MTTATNPKTRSPLPAVEGRARWSLPAAQIRERLEMGLSVPLVARRAGEGHTWEGYVLQATPTGWSLTHIKASGSEKVYHLPHHLGSCDCPDHRLNSKRRVDGQCKHRKLILALLASIGCDPTF